MLVCSDLLGSSAQKVLPSWCFVVHTASSINTARLFCGAVYRYDRMAEDAVIADAMIQLRNQEDAERILKRASWYRELVLRRSSLVASRARIAEEQEQLCEERARLRLMREA